MSEFEEIVKHSHELAVEMKTGDDDGELVPVMVLGFEGATFPCMMAGMQAGQLLEGVQKAIRHVKSTVVPEIEKQEGRSIGKMQWMTLSCDTYVQKLERLSDDETREEAEARRYKGYLGEHFKNGAADVYEAIITTGCAVGGEQIMVTHIYRYTPVDGYEWENADYTVGGDGDPRWSFESLDAS